MKIRFARSAGLAALFSALSGSAFAALSPGNAAEVVALTGQGDYRLPSGAQWSPASLKLQLPPQSQVRTGLASTMGLLLADQAQIKLGQNSVFQLRAIAGNSAGGTRLWLQQGKAWSQTKNAGIGLTMQTPTMTAGIQGTDWLLEVNADGSSTITVLSGLVAVSNEFGAVDVGKNETATALPGQPPVKRKLVSTADRAQWVTSHALLPGDFPEWADLLGKADDWSRHVPEYLQHLAQLRSTQPSVGAWLLAAELQAWAGDTAAARQLIGEGRARYPDETRFGLLDAQLAIDAGDAAAAHRALDPLPDSFTRALLQGQLAHFEGRADVADAAYQHAIDLRPDRPEGWLGLGTVRAERDDYTRARAALETARTQGSVEAQAELATLATQADLPTEAAAGYRTALAANPADYVAWTGLGIAELKAGHDAAALDALLHANTIEPRYARSVLYMAVAYYRVGKVKAAQQTLTRAAELDPNDPLPWRMMAVIARDQWQPDAALVADREALVRQPHLRSLDPLAVDRAGSTDLGGALSDLGLADWASRVAQDGYYPYWGGSHLFLATQYPQGFDRSAELMQGFLTDPTAFGIQAPRQPLLPQPAAGGELAGSAYRIGGGRIYDSHAVFNGYRNADRPVAWLVDLDHQRRVPDSDGLTVNQRNATVGLGGKLTPTLGAFVYANRLHVDADNASPAQGDSWRVDTGLGWRLGAAAMTWLKAGEGRDDVQQQNPGTLHGWQRTQPVRHDVQWRISQDIRPGWTASAGAESWRTAVDKEVFAQARNPTDTRQYDDDHGAQLWASLGADQPMLQWQADLMWQRYDKTKSELTRTTFTNGRTAQVAEAVQKEQQGAYPRLGLRWRPWDALTLRSAWQDWIRPYSDGTLMPVATAGVPLADQYVLPGGHQRRLRLQADWQPGDALVSLFADRMRVSDPHLFGQVDNTPLALYDLASLQLDTLTNFDSVETLEHASAFGRGRLTDGGVEADWLLSPHWAASAGYVYSESQNLGPEDGTVGAGLAGTMLPYVPRHRARMMLTWTASSLRIQGELAWRSERRTSEVGGDTLPAGWQTRLHAQWRSEDARWQIDGYLSHQMRTDHPTALGATLVWKY